MYRKIVKVFLGSPGDLSPERTAASRVTQEINRNHADFWNVQIELVGWEDTVSRFGRAQSVINQDLDQCEYFVGMMWQRWGSPPGDETHPYSSGFEEEFQRSVERRAKTGTPEISLLFKVPEEGRMQDPGKELTKVLQFKKAVIDEKKILFQEFRDVPDFEVKFRSLLVNYVQRMILSERANEEKTEAGAKGETTVTKGVALEDHETHLFVEEAASFLREILSRNDPTNTVSAADIARLRLLGAAVRRGGNDTDTLGPHDANLIYAEQSQYTLTRGEISGLVTSGVAHLGSENVPLWGWLFQSQDGPEGELAWQTLIRDDALRAPLIKCFTKGRFPLKVEGLPLGREHLLQYWLDSDADDIKNATIEYLEYCGDPEDLKFLEPLFTSVNSSVSERAILAAIIIISKNNLDDAFDLIEKHAVSTIPTRVLNTLFGHPSQIRSERLEVCLSHRSADIRRHALRILFSRGQISGKLAAELIADNSPETRYEALKLLQRDGRVFTLEDAKKILVRTTRSPRGLGLLMGQTTTEGDEFYEKFERDHFMQKSRKDLEELTKEASVYEFEANYALYEKHYKELFSEIERNLDDVFSTEFNTRMENFRQKIGAENDILVRIEAQSPQIRKEICRRVLSIVCKHANASAVDLVRRIIDRDQPFFLVEAIEYLERHGAWEDAQRIADFAERKNYSKRGLLHFDSEEEKRAARAILKIGKDRIADVLSLNLSSEILAAIIEGMTNKQFSELSNSNILNFMNLQATGVRKAAALKATLSLTKKRNIDILKTYTKGDNYRYYNVIHWLDVAVNTPVSFAKSLAMREISNDDA
ncbi:DUF4062 domain-containing protein [Rhizobium hainanense]|uniref:DUF4062 domain-containing protein n=1 Tax=Rhizobium hainanense TaxID=52131 RepID=A0A1C3VXQ1_9HYPH|nr:DUF4062 domain-containing protein [Rhizobium hainanense]SCB32458.1 protein of unknown function [Rhizobium hainanense]